MFSHRSSSRSNERQSAPHRKQVCAFQERTGRGSWRSRRRSDSSPALSPPRPPENKVSNVHLPEHLTNPPRPTLGLLGAGTAGPEGFLRLLPWAGPAPWASALIPRGRGHRGGLANGRLELLLFFLLGACPRSLEPEKEWHRPPVTGVGGRRGGELRVGDVAASGLRSGFGGFGARGGGSDDPGGCGSGGGSRRQRGGRTRPKRGLAALSTPGSSFPGYGGNRTGGQRAIPAGPARG